MNPLERLAEKLSLTRAEILTISALLAFLLLGSILRTIQSSELEAAALQRAEAAMFSDAETDSLIQLAVRDQARVAEIVKESLEETASRRNRNEDKMARKAPKKPFTGTVVFNRAGSEELQQIKGIGPVMAERLIAFRTENGGRITTFKELLKVKGVGLKKLEILKKHLSLE
ncbi:MAG: helix-hairpin-helix domain-containing protein [Chlorobium sp.]|nr:helix-hairpin-helix domain-containing protein [Chlorobium phaeovibrioides]NQU46937.1 helix-hairpin-helix domain-containing protein [Chlorobium sp.]